MANNTLYVTVGRRSYEDGDYRCWGTVTDYYKEFHCIKCRKIIGTKIVPKSKFCPECGAELNGKVEDAYVKDGKKLLATTKRNKNKLLKTVNGDNYYTVSKQITELDKEINDIEEAIDNWKNFNYSGSLPTGYNILR